MREALGASPGERVLDVGCGPGFYCAELLEDVGPSGAVVGVDGSAAMLGLAAAPLCGATTTSSSTRPTSPSLPVEDAAFDAALSVQVQEYVPDVAASLAELARVLRPGGRAVVFDVDWATLSVHSDEPALTERVLEAWDEHLAHPSLPRTLAPKLRAAGFEDVRVGAHPFVTRGLRSRDLRRRDRAVHRRLRGRVARASPRRTRAAWVAAQRALGERGEFYFAVTQFCFTARKPR